MSSDSNEVLLTLVPEVPEVDKERLSTFRVYSVPGDPTSTRYDFVIMKINGTEGVRPILNHGGVCAASKRPIRRVNMRLNDQLGRTFQQFSSFCSVGSW